ncbi:hypothetical protein GpartN1_g5667.t1 [Galdieria partita]|uniref:Large ribosomal subunit protein mL45 n=1 Tax=Galdieria partita TaxID=83374 RepID=A0A9C7Q1N2_9RHOD|nr:hypothetical protein GpartN1_g5667.t1 [Galdieria partita]
MSLLGNRGFLLLDKKRVYKAFDPRSFTWRLGTMRYFAISAKGPSSANGIVDPYDPSLEWKPWYVDVTRRMLASLRDVQAMAVMQRQMGRFKVKDFKEEAFQIYRQVNEAFAAGNKKLLFQFTTPLAFKDFCIALDNRPPLERHVWKLGKLFESEIVRTRVFRWRSGNKKDICAQITLRFHLSRALGVYNSKGERILGDADKMEPITEHIVFQRSLYLLEDFSWKYVGRIQVTRE